MNTPSVSIVAAATAEQSVVDGLGRNLTLRRLTALDKLRLFKAAGPDLALNEAWLGMAMLASSVTAIDNIPVPPPANEQQIEALVSRLGDAGITAAADALLPDDATGVTELVASAGNLPGTLT